MIKFKKAMIIAIAILCGLSTTLLTVGCKNNNDENLIEVNEVTHSIFYAPLYVAINNGYFKDENLEINLTNGGGSDTSMSALLTNSADIILAGPETVVYTQQEGIKDKPIIFGQLTTCDGSFILSKEKNENFKLSDLVGETIIGGRKGGLPAMTLQYIIEKNNLKIGTGTDKVNLRTDVAFNLISSVWDGDRSIKYCTLFEPTATNVAKESNAHIVASLGKLSGKIPYTCFATKESFLDKNKDKAKKFLKAISRAYDFISNSNSLEVAKSLKASFESNSLEELKISIEQYKSIDAWSNDMILTEESFSNLMEVMLNAKVITEKANWANAVNNQIAKSLQN